MAKDQINSENIEKQETNIDDTLIRQGSRIVSSRTSIRDYHTSIKEKVINLKFEF